MIEERGGYRHGNPEAPPVHPIVEAWLKGVDPYTRAWFDRNTFVDKARPTKVYDSLRLVSETHGLLLREKRYIDRDRVRLGKLIDATLDQLPDVGVFRSRVLEALQLNGYGLTDDELVEHLKKLEAASEG